MTRVVVLEKMVDGLENGTRGPFPIVREQMARLSEDVRQLNLTLEKQGTTLNDRIDGITSAMNKTFAGLLTLSGSLIATLIVLLLTR